MKVLKIVCLLILLIHFKLNAQSFYVSSPKDPFNVTLGSNLYKVTRTSTGFVSELVNTCSPGDRFLSIAMNKTGFYWLDGNQIFRGDMDGTSLTNCSILTTTPITSNALTMGSDGKIYYSNGILYSTDPQTSETKMLGNSHYPPSGDLSFFDGQLYETGTGLDLIDIQNPGASYVYMPLTGIQSVFGLVSVSTNLHKNTMYAFSNIYANINRTDVIELDIVNKQVIGVIGSLPYLVIDAASPAEDGSILGIKINAINVHQDCTKPAKGIIEVVTAPNAETFTYTLSNGLTNTTGMFSDVNPGSYQLTVTSSNDVQTANVTVPSYSLVKPDYKYKVDNQVCDAPGKITFSTTSTGYQVQFGNDVFPLNYAFSNLNTSSYAFKILNENGCVVDELNILLPRDKCSIQFDKTDVMQQCDAIHKGQVQVLTKPHNGAYTYSFNGQSNTTGFFNNIGPGNYKIKITSAEDLLEVPFIVPDYKLTQPAITYAAIDEVCADKGSVKFAINANSTLYKIQYGAGTFPFDHTFDNLSAGNYHFLVLTQSGCMVDEYDVQINRKACPIIIDQLTVNPECNVLGKGLIRVTVQQMPAVNYTYTLNNTTVNTTGVFNLLSPGTYQVKVSSSDGGIAQTRTVIVPDYNLNKPVSKIEPFSPVCDLTGQIRITVSPQSANYSIRYNGSVYPSGHTFAGLYEGSYHFSVLKSDGCIADDYDVKLVREGCSTVTFPSAFSPNNDGVNDVFRADPASKATNFNLKVYDRWGALIFSSTNLQTGWDGTYKGRPLPLATYYYFATFNTQENKQATLKGYVALIR